MGDSAKESLWLALSCSPVPQPGPAQAFAGFPANLDGHETKVLI